MFFGERSERQFRWGVQLLVAVVALGTMLLFGPSVGLAADKSDKSAARRQEAEALIQKALAVSDVRAAGSAQFGMRGTIFVNGAKKHVADGNYLLLWAAPDRWREEIQFHDYSRVRTGAKNAYWQTRSIDYELLPIDDLSGVLDFPRHLRGLLHRLTDPTKAQGQTQTQLDLAKRKIKGRQQECVLFRRPYQQNETYCFDMQSGALVGEENMPWEGRNAEYSDFSTFSGKIFPGTIQVKRGDQTEVQFHLNGISPLGKMDDNTFEAPPNATLWGSCADEERPKEMYAPAPQYPRQMIEDHVAGNVYVYAVVGIDEMLHDMRVLPESNQRLVPSTMGAISTWNYAPTSCEGAPLPRETVVTVTYTIGG